MQGMHFNGGQVPWKRLYLHGLVRAADGQKMSKSKGNVVDPLLLIDEYGADALRFFMAAMESQGRDVKMDKSRVEGYRNFATKLWNAARFCQSNGIGASTVARSASRHAGGQQMDHRRGGRNAGRARQGHGRPALRCGGQCDLPLRLGPVLRLVYRADQADPVPLPLGEGLGVGSVDQAQRQADMPHPNPSPEGEGLEETKLVAGWVLDQISGDAASAHAVRDRGVVGGAGGPGELSADYREMARAGGEGGCGGQARGRMADRIGRQSAHRQERTRHCAGCQARSLPARNLQPATRAIIAANPGAIDRLARLSAIHFAAAPAGAAMQLGRRGCQSDHPAGRRDRHRRRKGPPRQGAGSFPPRKPNRSKAACPTRPSSRRPSPRRSTRRAPIMPCMLPRPSGWRRRLARLG